MVEEPIPDRDLCIDMTPDKSETSYPSQIPTPSQEPINGPITQEKTTNNTDTDIPYLINSPKEVLFQGYLLQPWI